MNKEFWQRKRVLVTGHTGFKGSWLSLLLLELGANVIGYALKPSTTKELFVEAGIGQLIESVTGDIRDYDLLRSVVRRVKPEIIIHMAAQPLVRYSYYHPYETFSTNVMGTVNILEASRETSSVRSVVNVTTDKCYENKEWIWGYREIDQLGGHDPYSSSKACSEIISSAYRTSYFSNENTSKLSIATARAGNVIGGGDWALDRLVPDVLNAFENGNYPIVRNPNSIRPWQHVLEPIRGYLTLAQKNYEYSNKYAEAWNFGPELSDIRTVEYVVNKLEKLWCGDLKKPKINKTTQETEIVLHESKNLILDNTKSKLRLQWCPLLKLDDALTLTIQWYKSRINGENVQSITINQIKEYQNMISKINS